MLHKAVFSPNGRKPIQTVPSGAVLRTPAEPMDRYDKQHDSAFLADRGCLCKPYVGKSSAGSHAA